MSTEILVVDDDPEVRHLLRTCFEREGYIVSEACDAVGARTALERSGIGLVTLDLTLGRDDGLTLAREIRAAGDVPIVMVSGKGDAVDRIVGLELGADDYICKPFNLPKGLHACGRLRRHEANGPASTIGDLAHERFSFGSWTLDVTNCGLQDAAGSAHELTTGEFNLLEMFVRRPHRVLSRDDIMDLLRDTTGRLSIARSMRLSAGYVRRSN